jgi:DamX protein
MKMKLNNKKPSMSQDQGRHAYISSAWQQHADLITHLSQFSQNLLLVTAPEQGGKSTFIAYLAQMSLPTLKRKVIQASAKDTTDSLMQKVAQAFECAWEGMDCLVNEIERAVETACEEQCSVVLLVDDAHLLSDQLIHSLLQLISSGGEEDAQLHLVLFGEPSLELRLFSDHWNDRLQGKVYTIELESWTLDDIRAFWARDSFAPRLNESQLAALFEKTMGFPGSVAHEKSALLGRSNSKGKNMQKSRLLRWGLHPVFLGIIMGSLIGGGYLVFNGLSDIDNGSTVNLALASEEAWNNEPIQPQLANLNTYSPVATKAELTEAYEEDATPDEEGRAMPLASNVPALPVVDIPKQEEEPIVQASIDVPEPVLENSIPAQQIPPPAVPAVSKVTRPVAKVQNIAQNKAQNKSQNKTQHKVGLSREELHLLSLNKKHYTLQLIGSRTEEKAKQFIAQHGISKKAYTYKTKVSGKDWYVVVYGDYPSKNAAKIAMNTMPPSLKAKELKPWVREVESVHKDLTHQA